MDGRYLDNWHLCSSISMLPFFWEGSYTEVVVVYKVFVVLALETRQAFATSTVLVVTVLLFRHACHLRVQLTVTWRETSVSTTVNNNGVLCVVSWGVPASLLSCRISKTFQSVASQHLSNSFWNCWSLLNLWNVKSKMLPIMPDSPLPHLPTVSEHWCHENDCCRNGSHTHPACWLSRAS